VCVCVCIDSATPQLPPSHFIRSMLRVASSSREADAAVEALLQRVSQSGIRRSSHAPIARQPPTPRKGERAHRGYETRHQKNVRRRETACSPLCSEREARPHWPRARPAPTVCVCVCVNIVPAGPPGPGGGQGSAGGGGSMEGAHERRARTHTHTHTHTQHAALER